MTYAVVGGDGKFGVTSDGAIYVNGSLDYETKILYTFLVSSFRTKQHGKLLYTNLLISRFVTHYIYFLFIYLFIYIYIYIINYIISNYIIINFILIIMN